MLELRSVSKRYGGTLAVNGVSFLARAGEITGYLGPNGSGKSTTINPLVWKQRLGYVPEEPILYNFQSGTEYLQLVGRLRELNSRLMTRRIEALLELFGLSDAANQEIGSYSKGMKQKVMLIAALVACFISGKNRRKASGVWSGRHSP